MPLLTKLLSVAFERRDLGSNHGHVWVVSNIINIHSFDPLLPLAICVALNEVQRIE